ncbi:amidohydrolase family protein, partial [Steroidobacter sp.]|uniref:amidohydrolase family protein n=1 Tax=Steroidobacter sp. TaxID=1978227 RepID=UPI001A5AE3F7
EVLSGKSIIHVHSYRQDELLAFMRLTREFGIVPVFHHVSEGYKVADEMAAMGAGASTFPDYWGFRFETADGIPYNMALMTRQGVVVSLGSDSSAGAPNLNIDAVKAVRYGALSESEALQLVTLNPARQMRVQQRIGSLEPGKDADFVLWSDHPLSVQAKVLQTWIDGRRYFDADEDRREQARIERERARLIDKVRGAAAP